MDERKRRRQDFVLWKAAKPGEPEWDSPWGPGRPGWHIECSAMSAPLSSGEQIDIHGGGRTSFPHHENEIAQAEAAGHEFAHYWLHNGMVNVEGEKMSKSLGNFTTLADVFERCDPRAFRLFLLQTHYRRQMEVGDKELDDAKKRRASPDARAACPIFGRNSCHGAGERSGRVCRRRARRLRHAGCGRGRVRDGA